MVMTWAGRGGRGSGSSRLKGALEAAVREARANPRVLIGLVAILLLLWGYGLIGLFDSVDAAGRRLADAEAEIVAGQPVAEIVVRPQIALVAAAATSHGWRVTYAAPALPAEEIAAAAIHHGVFAVALSLVHPEDDPMLPAELRRLRRLLPQAVHLLVGGRAAGAYRSVLVEIGAAEIATLEDLTAALGQLRQGLR